MAETFFWYDLETTGISPRSGRVMQFAGRRTDLNLKPLGEPVNCLIKLADDVLPEPEAIMLTGITPQQTLQEGVTETEFLKLFSEEVATPGTIFVGFNSIRFDDEFMRFMNYRNYYDPYEWQWADNRSKWDLLDVVRMTRALRPEGINWPFDSSGKPTNRLELLTKLNGLDHSKAHDALSDVDATIAVADLIKTKQPKLFDYLLNLRSKKAVASLVGSNEPFIYTSGRYDSAYEKTTVVKSIGLHPSKSGVALVFDLRFDPTPWLKLTAPELAERLRFTRDESAPIRLPVKPLQYNHCPAAAPLGVLDKASQERLQIDLKKLTARAKVLADEPDFIANVSQAFALNDKDRQVEFARADSADDVEAALYDGFFDSADKNIMRAVRAAKPSEIEDISQGFRDGRLRNLMQHYKARNYPESLTSEELKAYEKYRFDKLFSGGQESALAKFFAKLASLAERPNLSDNAKFILEELQLYGQSIIPAELDN